MANDNWSKAWREHKHQICKHFQAFDWEQNRPASWSIFKTQNQPTYDNHVGIKPNVPVQVVCELIPIENRANLPSALDLWYPDHALKAMDQGETSSLMYKVKDMIPSSFYQAYFDMVSAHSNKVVDLDEIEKTYKQPLKTVKHKYYKNNFRRVEKTETGAGELKWTKNWMTLSTLIKLLNARIRSNKK